MTKRKGREVIIPTKDEKVEIDPKSYLIDYTCISSILSLSPNSTNYKGLELEV